MKKTSAALLALTLELNGCEAQAPSATPAECLVTPNEEGALEVDSSEEVLDYCSEFQDSTVTCLLNAFDEGANFTSVWDFPCDASTLEQDLKEFIFDYDEMPAEKTCWTGGATIECE